MNNNALDRVLIEGLTVITTIGAYEWEKTIQQKLVLDIEMAWDNQPAGLSDNVALCLDYAQVSQRVTNFLQAQRFELIERVAEEIARLLIKEFNVPWLRLKVSKPSAVPAASNVAVVIERRG